MKETNDQYARASAPSEAEAREYFPRGLIQPAGSFRFSVDALLLAEFATTNNARPLRGLDLGCGCGVVAFGIMLNMPGARFIGLDINASLTEAARENAVLLGLAERYATICGDLNQYKNIPELKAGHFDLVVANPPYRKNGSGYPPSSELREAALFESHGDLDIFVAAAARALKNGSRFCCIYSAERLAELCVALDAHRLTPKRICPVHGKTDDGAQLILLEARLNTRPGLKWEAPLYYVKTLAPA